LFHFRDDIGTYTSARAVHDSLPDDVEREFAFLQVCRAMLVRRRVVAMVNGSTAIPGTGLADSGDHGAHCPAVQIRGAMVPTAQQQGLWLQGSTT
jgi:hypothetical protein